MTYRQPVETIEAQIVKKLEDEHKIYVAKHNALAKTALEALDALYTMEREDGRTGEHIKNAINLIHLAYIATKHDCE